MPGSNDTGVANTEDYSLGRGKPFLATLTNNLPGAYRFLGNAPEFNINLETETLEHQASTGGLKVVDKEVTISQKIGLTISLDELNFQNLALYFSGSVATYTNRTKSGATFTVPAAAGGVSYDIIDNTTKDRCYDLPAYAASPTGSIETLVSAGTIDVDFTLDLVMGRIFVVAGGALEAGATVTVEADSGASNLDEVKALTQSTVSGALKFIAENPAANSHQFEFQFHKVALKAEGDFGLISDDWTVMQLSGSAERNITADADSPTLTIRTYDSAVAA